MKKNNSSSTATTATATATAATAATTINGVNTPRTKNIIETDSATMTVVVKAVNDIKRTVGISYQLFKYEQDADEVVRGIFAMEMLDGGNIPLEAFPKLFETALGKKILKIAAKKYPVTDKTPQRVVRVMDNEKTNIIPNSYNLTLFAKDANAVKYHSMGKELSSIRVIGGNVSKTIITLRDLDKLLAKVISIGNTKNLQITVNQEKSYDDWEEN